MTIWSEPEEETGGRHEQIGHVSIFSTKHH